MQVPLGEPEFFYPGICWLMAACILHRGGPWLYLLLVLQLLLQPAHHGKDPQTQTQAITVMKPHTMTTTDSVDCCQVPWQIEKNFVVRCILDGATVTANGTRMERMPLDPATMDCVNITVLSHGSNCNVFVINKNYNPLYAIYSDAGLSPVKNLVVQSVTSHDVTLRWENPPGCCSVDHDGRYDRIPSDSWNMSCTAQISGLLAGQKYIMVVYKVLQDAGSSEQRTFISVTTRPSPVQNVKEENSTENSLTIAWTIPGNCSTYSYWVLVCECLSPSVCSYNQTCKSPCTVSTLNAGVMYTVTVYVVTNDSVWSEGTGFNATTVPNRPRNISVTARGTQNLSIAWDSPDVNVRSSYLYWVTWVSKNNTEPEKNRSTKSLSYTLESLEPGKLYLVTLTSEINSVKSAEAELWTLTNPLDVANFSICAISQTSANLSWELPSPSFSGIMLLLQKHPSRRDNALVTSNTTTSVPLSNTTTNVSLRGLAPCSSYNFTLYTVAGWNNQTVYSVGVWLERATMPQSVSDVKCLPLEGGYSLQVSWTCSPSVENSTFLILTSGVIGVTWLNCQEPAVVGNLQPARSYAIQVVTRWNGYLVESDPVVCSTDSTGVIVGAVFAGLFALVLFCLLLFYFRSWQVNTSEKQKATAEMSRVLHPVPVSSFACYFCNRFSDSSLGFAKEYQQLWGTGTGQSQNEAERPENQVKNRYSNVLPYDRSRVRLTPKPGDPNSDYINASYMLGYQREKEFIAAQGPLPGTVQDFWRMVWEQQVMTIVMLTNCAENGRVKCARYWPLDYTPCTYGDMTVSVITETILPDWTIRDFSMKWMNVSEVRLARHFHYTSWPDHGTPQITRTVLCFQDIVRKHIEQQEESGPALVHCSAGVGRTGTFIALDSLLRQAQNEERIGVFSFVQKMRMDRPLMIQTESQYIFLHQCLLDWIQSTPENDSKKAQYTAMYENTLAFQHYEVSRV